MRRPELAGVVGIVQPSLLMLHGVLLQGLPDTPVQQNFANDSLGTAAGPVLVGLLLETYGQVERLNSLRRSMCSSIYLEFGLAGGW